MRNLLALFVLAIFACCNPSPTSDDAGVVSVVHGPALAASVQPPNNSGRPSPHGAPLRPQRGNRQQLGAVRPPPPLRASVQQAPVLAAAGGTRPPVIPASWTVSDWFFDPANSTGCASDLNSCTSATCAASNVGPCVTYGEVAARFGTYSPRLGQNTTMHFLSSQSNLQGTTDPVYFTPYVENFLVRLVTVLTPFATVVLPNTVVPLVKSPAPGNLWQADFGASGAPGVFAIDITPHAPCADERFFLYTSTGVGTNFNISQPLEQMTPGLFAPHECTIANGDTVRLYHLVAANLAQIDGQPGLYSGGGSIAGIYVENFTLLDPVPGNFNSPHFGAHANLFESVMTNGITIDSAVTDAINYYVNNYTTGLVGIIGGSTTEFTAFLGGVSDQFNDMVNPAYDADIILQEAFGSPEMTVGSAYLLTSSHVGSSTMGIFAGELQIIRTFDPAIYTYHPTLWGPGDVDTLSFSRVIYRTGAGEAAATFLQGGGIKINQQTIACNGSAAALPANCNVVLTPADLDAPNGPAGFSSNAWVPGGGSYSNGSP